MQRGEDLACLCVMQVQYAFPIEVTLGMPATYSMRNAAQPLLTVSARLDSSLPINHRASE